LGSCKQKRIRGRFKNTEFTETTLRDKKKAKENLISAKQENSTGAGIGGKKRTENYSHSGKKLAKGLVRQKPGKWAKKGQDGANDGGGSYKVGLTFLTAMDWTGGVKTDRNQKRTHLPNQVCAIKNCPGKGGGGSRTFLIGGKKTGLKWCRGGTKKKP